MSQTKENTGISLLHKSKRNFFRAIFSRFGLIVLLMLVQISVVVMAIRWFEGYLPHVYTITILFSVVMALYLLNSQMNPTAKITWLLVITLMPVFGALLYLYTQNDIGHRALKGRLAQLTRETINDIPQDPETLKKLKETSPGAAALAHYITRSGCYPVYDKTDVTYFPSGEAKFQELLQQLEQAQHFIFLEYFIINEGIMWGQILEILARKASEGVDVRVMYDGTCEFSTLPHNYPQLLHDLGIQCKIFAPVTPFVSTRYNYRDHRKILVIDGHTAFTGGVNLADEYINHTVRFGHWKDTAIMLRGEAVRSFTLMFLQMWAIDEYAPEFGRFLTAPAHPQPQAKGFVIPYGDIPLDNDKVGKHVYMDILNQARRYVHIMTPYLILDGEMADALVFAAKRGVDVRIILPGIPDKKTPYGLACTHYKALLAAGVRIFEYTPGFVHAKNFVCDDLEAVVGTINLDYRSLYHHFECAAYLWNVDCIADIEQDFLETQALCREITPRTRISLLRRITGILLKAVAPLL